MKTALLSLLITLVVACFGAYQFEKYQTFVDNTQTALSRIDSEIKPELSQLNATLSMMRQELSVIRQEEDWKIAEAKHLIRLSLERLQVSGDLNTSLRLLQAADQQLQSINDPRLIPVREMLKQDQLALAAVKWPHKEELWLTITVLLNKVSELPTRGVRFSVPSETKEAKQAMPVVPVDQQTTTGTWKAELERRLQDLKDLVRIQHHSKPIEPILSQNQQLLAKENLRLLLEQLRWSILHDNDTIYQTTIQQTIEWLNTYFEQDDEQVKQLQTTLTQFAAIHLHPKLPDIGQALQLLQNIR